MSRTASFLLLVAAVGAAALVACNAITGLDGDYRLAKQGEDASPEDSGPDADDDGAVVADAGTDADVEDAASDDGAVVTDAGTDATTPADAGFCDGDDIVFCTDFEDATSDSGAPAFGLEGAQVVLEPASVGSVSVVDGAGTGGSRGLVAKLSTSTTGTRRAFLRVDLGPASSFDHLDMTFDLKITTEGLSVPDFLTLGAFANRANLKPDYGIGLSAGTPSTFIQIYDNVADPDATSRDAVAQRAYQVHLRAERNDGGLAGTVVELSSQGTTLSLSKPATPRSLAAVTELSLALGIYNASKDRLLEVHVDNVKVTGTKN